MTDIRSSEISIQNHLRRYYSLLESGTEFLLSELFESYKLSKPSLHKLVNSPEIDQSALKYATDRLPSCINLTKKIIISQDASHPQGLIEYSSPARRRQNFFDPTNQTLTVLTCSDSDLDDFINCLIAYQIETSKNSKITDISIIGYLKKESTYQSIAANWWKEAINQSLIIDFANTPIYFISSNFHSLTNIIGNYSYQRQDQIIEFIRQKHPDLYQQWEELKSSKGQIRVIDFLYYLSGKFFSENKDEKIAKNNYEASLGIKVLKLKTQLPCDIQLIPISAIAKTSFIDPNLNIKDRQKFVNSRGYIVNIEYPLGFAAYYLYKEILSTLTNLKGTYIIGKAAILTGEIGDIQIPETIFDERTNNVFHPKNVFNSYFPFPTLQTHALRRQKAIAVYGPFLENEAQLTNYISAGFNIIEMESGPYLTALYEHLNKLSSQPNNTVAHIDDIPFDFGIINYASDNPLSHTLGESPMSLRGIEPTYLAAITVLQRIIDLETI